MHAGGLLQIELLTILVKLEELPTAQAAEVYRLLLDDSRAVRHAVAELVASVQEAQGQSFLQSQQVRTACTGAEITCSASKWWQSVSVAAVVSVPALWQALCPELRAMMLVGPLDALLRKLTFSLQPLCIIQSCIRSTVRHKRAVQVSVPVPL